MEAGHGRRRVAPCYSIDAELTVPDGAEPGRAILEIHTRLSAEPFEVPLVVVGGEALTDTGAAGSATHLSAWKAHLRLG